MGPEGIKKVLLVISGSVAAYKSLELIRRLREIKCQVACVMTKSACEFITPLSVSSLSGQPVYTDLFSLKDETEMGHIKLSREADIVIVAPATADILAKMANGLADDLASAVLLACNKQIIAAPAMNAEMWNNKATRRNIEKLKEDGIIFAEPKSGALACGETGMGRMAEIEEILDCKAGYFASFPRPLAGKKAVVTSGPTFEPIDPVRFIGNRSSGKQGAAIAQALIEAGAEVTVISGSVSITYPESANVVKVETAEEMLSEAVSALPADIAVCAAAVSDFRIEEYKKNKIKKDDGLAPLDLVENPDILETISNHAARPRLVVGFAAETENLLANAKAKLKKKGCDWILANDVMNDVFGQDTNEVVLVSAAGTQKWHEKTKIAIAQRLTKEIERFFNDDTGSNKETA